MTNSKGSNYASQHMWGIAFDIAIKYKKDLYDPATIKKVAKIAKKIGLAWGGGLEIICGHPTFLSAKMG